MKKLISRENFAKYTRQTTYNLWKFLRPADKILPEKKEILPEKNFKKVPEKK